MNIQFKLYVGDFSSEVRLLYPCPKFSDIIESLWQNYDAKKISKYPWEDVVLANFNM